MIPDEPYPPWGLTHESFFLWHESYWVFCGTNLTVVSHGTKLIVPPHPSLLPPPSLPTPPLGLCQPARPLPRGTIAANCGYRLRFNSYQPSAVKLFSGFKNVVIEPCRTQDPLQHKINKFPSLLPGQQNKNKLFPTQRLQQTPKIHPGIHKNDFCGKLFFAIPSIRKPGFQRPERLNFESQINTKSDLETSPKTN